MKRSVGFPREECVPVDVVGPRLFFAGRARERADWWADLYSNEPHVVEHLLPAPTGQPAGNSTGPEIDVAQGLGWYRSAVGDVGELQSASRS